MSRTRYKFKGYTITNCGYHQPDHCVWWEAVDENGEACFHGHSLREVEFMILDDEWEKKLREKDAEIERLKHSSVGNAAAMLEALATLRKRFDNNTMAYQDRYFKFSGWHWHKKAKEAARWRDVFHELREVCDAALSAPARNCDKMPDIENLTMHDLAKSPCKSTLEYASREELLALVRWLLASAAEGGANA